MAMQSLRGQVAIVTGGSRGIGLAIARALVAEGVQVSATGRSEAHLASARAAIEAAGPGAVETLKADVRRAEDVQHAIDATVARFGGLDIVINNAAILRDAFVFKSERADWQRVIDNNLTGAWAVLAASTPVLRDATKSGRSPGRIVNIVSSAGLYGNFGQSAYAASKAGLVGLTRVVAMDMARSGVNCNAVTPLAATRVTSSIQAANEAQAEYKRRALTVPAAYVARLVGWLSMPGCTVTGQLFGVRGREVFLFSQPRPIARVVTAPLDELTPERLDAAVALELGDHFTDLQTDLEAFNTEPLI